MPNLGTARPMRRRCGVAAGWRAAAAVAALILLFALGGAAAPARAQLGAVVPDHPLHIATGRFSVADLFGSADASGNATKLDYSFYRGAGRELTATFWYLSGRFQGDRTRLSVLSGEARSRFGPGRIAYLALGGGVGKASGSGQRMGDGTMFTTGLGAEISRFSVEARTLSSVSRGRGLVTMLLLGYRF